MSEKARPTVAIVDYGMGNLFSVAQACRAVGLAPVISDDPRVVERAEGVILPGVGAFGDAMAVLRAKGLDRALVDYARSGRPLLGICLGMQLMMSESWEFGHHRGLELFPGRVVRFGSDNGHRLKVPHVGWEPVHPAGDWQGTLLEDLPAGVHLYFVHSFHAQPAHPELELARASYGPEEFCAAVARDNVTACQFHPERSGPAGLTVYRNLARRLGVPAPQEE